MKYWYLLFIALLPDTSFAEDKFLTYQYNDKVQIRISNVPCPIKTMIKDYPFAVVANRIDGQHLFGCYTHEKDNIVIQWAAGDKSVFPANVFLQFKSDT